MCVCGVGGGAGEGKGAGELVGRYILHAHYPERQLSKLFKSPLKKIYYITRI